MEKNPLEQLRQKVRGRSVALVGNAKSILASSYGEDIDAHDVVVRFNRGAVQHQQAQGIRTDVLGFSLAIEREFISEHFGQPLLVWLTPKDREKFAIYFESLPGDMSFYPVERWAKLSQALHGARPSSGMMMMDLICRLQPEAVNLFGFDFKKSRTFYLQEDHKGPHNWAREKDLAIKFIKRANGKIYH